MAQKTLADTRTNRIISNSATTAFADQLGVGENNASVQVQRGLILLPFTGIPEGSEITAVTLRVTISSDLADNTRIMRAYRFIQAWTADCTWNTYDGTNNWGTAGAHNTTTDAEATDIGSVSIGSTEASGEKSISLDVSKVQEWFDGIFTNNGLLLQMDTEDADLHDFDVAETEWDITYTPPDTGGNPIFFSSGGIGVA